MHDQAGVSSKKLELETTATAGKAVTGPTLNFVDLKTSCSSMFTEFASSSSSSSYLAEPSFSSSAKRTASSHGNGFNFSSPSARDPEEVQEKKADGVVSKKRKLTTTTASAQMVIGPPPSNFSHPGHGTERSNRLTDIRLHQLIHSRDS